MGEIIIRKVKGMNWMAKLGLVLIFTLAFSMFMYHGWQKPVPGWAAVGRLNAWTLEYQASAYPNGAVDPAYTIANGTGRVLIVAISSLAQGTGTTQTVNVSWGGQALTLASGDAGITARQHTYIYYLTESGINAVPGGTGSLNVTITGGTGNGNFVYAAVFTNTGGTPYTSARNWNWGSGAWTTIGPFNPWLSIAANDLGIEVITVQRTNAGAPRTINTWWQSWAAATSAQWSSSYSMSYIAERAVTAASTGDQSRHLASGTTWSAMSGVSLHECIDSDIATLTTTNPANGAYVKDGVVIQAQVGVEAAPQNMSNMHVDITGAGACNVTGGVMSWNATSSRWEYTWNNSACGTTVPVFGVTINVSGTDPDCATAVSAPQITNVAIDNSPAQFISHCGRCHGYRSKFDDGTGRNNPDGTFVGSHNAHVISEQMDCSVCHIAPWTTTSAAYNHRTGNIQMAVPINAEAGANYGNWRTMWAQTNLPAQSSCSVYCHSQGTGWTSNPGDPRAKAAPLVWLTWGNSGTCASCHGFPPNYASGTPKANSHMEHNMPCQFCHAATTTTGNSITGPTHHADRNYDIAGLSGTVWSSIGSYTFAADGGVCTNISCHGGGTAKWGTVGSLAWTANNVKCTYCHDAVAPRTKVTTPYMMNDIVAEFGKRYGHWATGNGPVTDGVCVVCHLEGKWGTFAGTGMVIRSTYHADGAINLRDPDGSGEANITNMAGTSWFTFERFSDSYGAGSRWSTYYTSDAIANVITQKFCLACHDSNGATNPTAWTSNRGTRDALMPFGGANLGANYTVLAGAAAAGKLINVKGQMWASNTSRHPVMSPLVKDFPTPARMNAPYNNFTRLGMSTIRSAGVTMNCFDCHNSNGGLLTTRTTAAHGTDNTDMVRGDFYANPNTLCTACHSGYTTDTQHNAGSAMQTNGNGGEGMATYCQNCHGSTGNNSTVAPARPQPASDYHGHRTKADGTYWSASNAPVYAFIRNTTNIDGTAYHRPFRSTPWYTTGSAMCAGTGRTSGCIGNGSNRNYTPGGSY